MTIYIRTKPEPYCPECGARMVLRRPKPSQVFDPFWGCSQYPDCKGTRSVKDVNEEPPEFWHTPRKE
jgi:DNA topoisomerase-3